MGAPHPALLDLVAGRALPAIGDSSALVRSAVDHRVHGLLWSAVRAGEVALDAPDRLALAGHAVATRSLQSRIWAALDRVAPAAAALGVDIATVKGVTAEARWYDAEGERPCRDLDLLVAPHHLDRVGALIRHLDPLHPLAGDVQALVDAGRLQSVQVVVADVPVDIHLDLFKLGVPSRQRDAIWQGTVPFPLPSGGIVAVLDAETALVHFLVHMNKDRFRWLLGYADVVHLLQRTTVDWDRVDVLAAGDGLEVPVRRSLAAVLDGLGLPRQGPAPLPGWRDVAWQRLWSERVRLQGDLGVVRFRHRQALLPALAPGRAPEALGLWARKLFPDPDLVTYSNGAEKGGYVRRLTSGRFHRAVQRHRDVDRLRRGGPQGPTPARSATRERG